MNVQASLLARSRWRAWEIAAWVVLWALPVVLGSHAALINEIAILALFALSLDLILGYAGIVSLGHAAFFGLGAYSAGLFAKHRNGIEYALDDDSRRGGVVRRDVSGLVVEVAQRLAQPPNPHSLSTSWPVH